MTDETPTVDRRSVLRMTGGAVAAATVGGVGTVAGAEEGCSPAEITTVVREENTGPTTASGDELPVVAGGGLLVTLPTEPFEFESYGATNDTTLAASCYDGYRIDATMTWNPTESGPTNAGLFLYEGSDLNSGNCIAKNANGEDDTAPMGTNRLTLSVGGSGTFEGTNSNGTEVSNSYTITPGTSYTLAPQGRTGAADFRIEARVLAYAEGAAGSGSNDSGSGDTGGSGGAGSGDGAGSSEPSCSNPKPTITAGSVSRSEGTFAGVPALTSVLPSTPVTAGGGVLAPYNTQPFSIEEGAFTTAVEDAGRSPDAYENRIAATMTWNPTESGPNNANLYLDQKTQFSWKVIGYATSDDALGGNVQGENRLELVVEDGETYDGEDASGNSVNNTAAIEGGRTYRFRPQNGTGVANWEIDAEYQAFAPACFGSGGE